MKRRIISLLGFIFIVSMAGCSSSRAVDSVGYDAVMRVYDQKIFEESFDEVQSVEQKKKILYSAIHTYGFDYGDFVVFMKNNHQDEYSSLF